MAAKDRRHPPVPAPAFCFVGQTEKAPAYPPLRRHPAASGRPLFRFLGRGQGEGGGSLGLREVFGPVRPLFVLPPDDGTLFLTNLGEAFTPNRLTQLVRNYVDAAEIGKKGSCHLFRHAMATLMHENGADIRFIQQMLGHARLDTTQIYTHISIRRLKEIHTMTHPAKMHSEAMAELKAELAEALAEEEA